MGKCHDEEETSGACKEEWKTVTNMGRLAWGGKECWGPMWACKRGNFKIDQPLNGLQIRQSNLSLLHFYSDSRSASVLP